MSFTCYDRNGHAFQATTPVDCVQQGGSVVPPPPILQPQGPLAGSQQALAQGQQTAQSTVSAAAGAVSGFTWPKPLQNFFGWFSSADNWKGIGLLAAAGVLGIVGLVLWTGKGSDTVKVSTTTGARIAAA